METSEKNEGKKDSFRMSLLKTLLKAAVAFGIIGYLYWSQGSELKNAGGILRSLRWGWLIPAAILYAFHIFVNAWRWHLLLLVRRIPCSLFEANSLTMQSFFCSLVMPGGAIGGDVVRAGFLARSLPKGQRFEGVFTILMDRFTGMLGIFALAILMLPFTWWCIGSASGTARSFTCILLAGSVAGLLGAFVVFRHRSFERFSWYLALRKITDRFSGGLFSQVEATLDSYSNAGKEILICVFASITGVNLTLAGVMYCVCLAFAPASEISVTAALAAITIGNIAGLLPGTPSGLGARDYFVASILAASAFPSNPVLPSTVMSLIIIGFNLLGGVFFLFSGHSRTGDGTMPKETDKSSGPGI